MEKVRPKGYALATILILLGVAMFGMAAIITISTIESKISRSQSLGMRAYYAAEAGMEDAIWKLNNTPAISSALIAGSLGTGTTGPYNYDSAENDPGTDLQYFVDYRNDTGPGYGIIEVTGQSNIPNTSFVARRKITAKVFQGTITSPTGTNGLFAGGAMTITNGAANIHIIGGDMYATSSIIANNTHVVVDGAVNSPGSLTDNGDSITSGALYTANNPPAAATIAAPGIDFNYYRNNNDRTYSAAQFQALFNNTSTVNLPGPVTYVSAGLAFGNWARNKTLNITGMLVVNGNISVNGSVTGFTVNVTDPGSGKSGIFARSNFSMSNGTWNIDGVVYASGDIIFTNTQAVTINGGLISGGGMQINTGLPLSLTYNSTRVAACFGSGSPLNVEVQHWEEEY